MSSNAPTSPALADFDWKPEPQAAALIDRLVAACVSQLPVLAVFAEQLRLRTGTRLTDWVDHLACVNSAELMTDLEAAGFQVSEKQAPDRWVHARGLFPPVVVLADGHARIVLKVDSVVDFLVANQLAGHRNLEGEPFSSCRRALIAESRSCEWWIVERQVIGDFPERFTASADPQLVTKWQEAFRLRRRRHENTSDGFDIAEKLITAAQQELDSNRVCNLFFAAERDYWERRNRAARVQKARQDTLGLGWSNHDHHTYRSSRQHFARLIGLFELLGLELRERFYAGREAGWGAQVMEHPQTGIVVFADVDLSPAEVFCDFAHEALPAQDRLGTIGLWCRLHGEAFLEAGMHHLECQFDYEAARDQLASEGVRSMKPFTDLPHLRQAFTEGEIWPVRAERIADLLRDGLISAAQAEQFRQNGAVGSHLEILQRNDGYKGFNKHGINEIIRDTDPRHQAAIR